MDRLIAVGVLALAIAPAPAFAQTCRTIGGSYFCSDGRAGQRSPINPSIGDKKLRAPLGNHRYTNPQRNAKDPGNLIFPADPTTTRRIGDTVYNPDGSRCRTNGASMACQ